MAFYNLNAKEYYKLGYMKIFNLKREMKILLKNISTDFKNNYIWSKPLLSIIIKYIELKLYR